MRSKKTILWLCVFALAGCRHSAPTTQPSRTYAVIGIEPGEIALETSYPASIQGKQDIDIFPKVSGFIEKVCVKEGEAVKKGQSLFLLEQVTFQAALQTARANVEAARAAVATAQLTYDSKQELFAREVVSQFDLSMAENQLLTAKAQLAQAEAMEVDAKNNLTYTVVKSPSDGVVGTLPYREGTLVSASMPRPLTVVSDNSRMYVYFSLPESELLTLSRTHGHTGRAIESMPEIRLRLNDGSLYDYTGRIETISGLIDASTGAVSLRAEFPNPEGLLRSGGSGNVMIPVSYADAVVIPQSATFEIQDKIYVYRHVDGTARQTLVSVARENNGRDYIVQSGLAPGEEIVVEGVGLLRDGMEINVQK